MVIPDTFATHNTDKQWGTVHVEKPVLELPYTTKSNSNPEKIKIFGTVEEPRSATWVYMTLTEPDGKTSQMKVVATSDGYYENFILICCNNIGKYSVYVEWREYHIGTVTFDVIQKSTTQNFTVPTPTSKTSTLLTLNPLPSTFELEDQNSSGVGITFSGKLTTYDRQYVITNAKIQLQDIRSGQTVQVTTDDNGKFNIKLNRAAGSSYAVNAVFDGSLNFESSKSQTEYFDVRSFPPPISPPQPPPQISPPQVFPPTEDPGDPGGGVFLLVIIMIVVIVAIAIKKRKKSRPVTIQTSSSGRGFEVAPKPAMVLPKLTKVLPKPAMVLPKPVKVSPKPEKKPKTAPKQKPRKETKKSSVKKAKNKKVLAASSVSQVERKEVPHGSKATEAEKQWIQDHEMTDSELEQYIKDTKDTQKYDDDGNLRSEAKSADRWNKNEEQNILKVCPRCGRQAKTEKEVEVNFGYRIIRGAKRPQSWCIACRTDKPDKIIKSKKSSTTRREIKQDINELLEKDGKSKDPFSIRNRVNELLATFKERRVVSKDDWKRMDEFIDAYKNSGTIKEISLNTGMSTNEIRKIFRNPIRTPPELNRMLDNEILRLTNNPIIAKEIVLYATDYFNWDNEKKSFVQDAKSRDVIRLAVDLAKFFKENPELTDKFN